MLYENSGKTANEVCKVVGVGRRIFFSYLAQQRKITLRRGRELAGMYAQSGPATSRRRG